MLFTKAALCLSSFVLLASAQLEDAVFSGVKPALSRTPSVTSNRLLMSRDLEKRCTGTCAECFGDGYILCPSSTRICYRPGDSVYGLDSCTSSGSGSGTATSSARSSTSTGESDTCYRVGASCTSCFGPTYRACPDGLHCYDPNDPMYDTCPDDNTGGSSGGSTGGSTGSSGGITTETCVRLYGSGHVPCGNDACYNPGLYEECCPDGSKSRSNRQR